MFQWHMVRSVGAPSRTWWTGGLLGGGATLLNVHLLPYAWCCCMYKVVCNAPLLPGTLTVSAFSKKTGDYGVLSSTDLKVIALAYELECQLGVERGENLRTAPLQQVMSAVELWELCTGVLSYKYVVLHGAKATVL